MGRLMAQLELAREGIISPQMKQMARHLITSKAGSLRSLAVEVKSARLLPFNDSGCMITGAAMNFKLICNKAVGRFGG
jgi:hypothetical protein